MRYIKLFEDHTVYANSDGKKFWGDVGSGVIFCCKSTGRVLVGLRSKFVNEPGTWGVLGGRVEQGETPEQAAKREVTEESGYDGKYQLIPAYVFKKPGFTYHNFLGVIEKEFDAELDWETAYTEWVTFDELVKLKPKHFGLKDLLKHDLKLIQEHVHPA